MPCVLFVSSSRLFFCVVCSEFFYTVVCNCLVRGMLCRLFANPWPCFVVNLTYLLVFWRTLRSGCVGYALPQTQCEVGHCVNHPIIPFIPPNTHATCPCPSSPPLPPPLLRFLFVVYFRVACRTLSCSPALVPSPPLVCCVRFAVECCEEIKIHCFQTHPALMYQ
jgi:hypothetical protein